MAVLGIYYLATGHLEGSDDPGKIFVKRRNIRTLMCALSLLQTTLQGCNHTEESNYNTWSLYMFTGVLGFLMLFAMWFFSCFRHEPGLREEIDGPRDNDANDVSSSGSALMHQRPNDILSRRFPLASAEAILTWIYGRIQQRMNRATDFEKRQGYESGLRMCQNLSRRLRDGNEATRRWILDMSDLSEDENSPNYGRSEEEIAADLSDAQHAYDFGAFLVTLRAAASNADDVTTLEDSTNAVNNLVGTADDNESDENEDHKTNSQMIRRYQQSTMSEVSDPDAWVAIHYGRSPENAPVEHFVQDPALQDPFANYTPEEMQAWERAENMFLGIGRHFDDDEMSRGSS